MAEEEVMPPAPAAATSPVPSDHKRKLEDLETEAPEPTNPISELPADSSAEPDADKNVDDVAEDGSPEAKRPKLDEIKSDGLVSANGFDGEKLEEHAEEDAEEEPSGNNEQAEDAPHPPSEGVTETVSKEEPSAVDHETNDFEKTSVDDSNNDYTEGKQDTEKQFEGAQDTEKQFQGAEEPEADNQSTSRKIDVPNDKVGVLIGKGGDTIRYLQYNSGARIQITRDADSDPHSTTRPVELIGTPGSINQAEKLISAVIAEADAGGSPSLVARGLPSAQAAGVADQLEMQVPNEKVGLIIGRGGDTIKALQAKSGARIQLIPQHLPEGDASKERTVRVTGNRKQIEIARDMIKDVMNQLNVKQSPYSGGYSQQQSYRPRGPTGPSNWGPRGPHSSQQIPYDYHHRGPYPSQTSQYPPPNYGGYPQQQMGPRSNFSSGWEQRPPSMQGPGPHGGGYDYYGGQGGHVSDHPAPAPISHPLSGHPAGPSPTPNMGHPPSQANYNYGQPHGPDYGHQGPYSQTAPPQQSYGHGYDEPKYDSHAQTQHPYGHGTSQPVYPQAAGSQPSYGAQQQYGKQPSYGMPSQGPPPQSYGPPRPSQPGDIPYQGTITSSQSYGSSVPPQQQYPYASSGPMQQSYPTYGSTATDGYNQAVPATGTGYPQQGSQPVQSYSQPGAQQATGYVQGPSGGYGSYPSSQQGYPEQQPAPNNAGYGYQGSQDPSAYGSVPGSAYSAPPSGQQPSYAQPTATQPSYDQSVPQPGAYGAAAPVSAPAGYGKTVSPQPGYPQYESAAQMYVTPR